MKLPAVAVLFGIAAVIPVLPANADAKRDDEAKIRALEDKFAAAFNAKDINGIMSVYVPDETLVVLTLCHHANMLALRRIEKIGRISSAA